MVHVSVRIACTTLDFTGFKSCNHYTPVIAVFVSQIGGYPLVILSIITGVARDLSSRLISYAEYNACVGGSHGSSALGLS